MKDNFDRVYATIGRNKKSQRIEHKVTMSHQRPIDWWGDSVAELIYTIADAQGISRDALWDEVIKKRGAAIKPTMLPPSRVN